MMLSRRTLGLAGLSGLGGGAVSALAYLGIRRLAAAGARLQKR